MHLLAVNTKCHFLRSQNLPIPPLWELNTSHCSRPRWWVQLFVPTRHTAAKQGIYLKTLKLLYRQGWTRLLLNRFVSSAVDSVGADFLDFSTLLTLYIVLKKQNTLKNSTQHHIGQGEVQQNTFFKKGSLALQDLHSTLLSKPTPPSQDPLGNYQSSQEDGSPEQVWYPSKDTLRGAKSFLLLASAT